MEIKNIVNSQISSSKKVELNFDPNFGNNKEDVFV